MRAFQEYLEDTRSKVTECLEAHLKAQKLILEEIDQHTTDSIIDTLISFSTRGKMFRAALLGLGFETARSTSQAEVPIFIQAGVELIQAGLLIQDDIVDGDENRRGLPTIHRLFATACQDWDGDIATKDADEIGRAMAMVASDLAIVLAYDLFLGGGFPPDIIIKATSQFNRNLIRTALGQAMDVSLHNPLTQSVGSILKAALYKTAYYTVVGPMQLGATLAGAKNKLLEDIEAFGRSVGLAYQLRDDVLDVFADKPGNNMRQWSDIAGNKPTFLIENTIRMTSGKERDAFLSRLGSSNPSALEMNTVRDIIERSGALAATTEKAERLADKGEKLIPSLTDNARLAELLRGICVFAVCREE